MGRLIDTIRSWFCRHEWELLQKTTLRATDLMGNPLKIIVGYEWTYVCKKCMKNKKIKA